MHRKAILAAFAILLAIFAGSDGRLTGSHARADTVTTAETMPVLTIPSGILAAGESTVIVPVHFANNLQGVAATAFSLTFDTACLAVILQNGALKPGVVEFNLPPQFNGSAYYEKDAPGGRIDIVIGDYATPLSTLPNIQNLVSITLRTTCLPPSGTTIIAPVTFAAHPATSFSNTLGHPISGRVVDGSVAVKRSIPAPTPTPTPTPGPTPVINSAPIAKEDTATTRQPEPVTINVLANDSDPDGDPLKIFGVTQGGLGEVKANANGTVTYTPTSERSGDDRFTYTISDGRGGLAAAAVWVTVTPANKPPVATNDTATTNEDIPVTINILANDSDPDADNSLLSIVVLGTPAHGTVHENSNGRAVYTPDVNYNGSDSFMYAVADRDGGSDVALVSITIRPVDDPPPTMIDSVDLIDFTIHEIDSKLELYWTTRSESDAAGYYIYRTQGVQLETGLMSMPYVGAWERVSPLIQGKGSSGGVYRYTDETAKPGVLYAYVLVAIDPKDNISLFGPHSATGPAQQSDQLLLPFVVRK